MTQAATFTASAEAVPNGPDEGCFHCGLPLPAGSRYRVLIEGAPREMCCPGCQAVAQAIVDGGLADYYRHRSALPERAGQALPAVLDRLALFDTPGVQRSFVRAAGEHEREAALILEGITCGACVWLNERHVASLPGVLDVTINYATRRARVRWDERRIRLSGILRAIAAIGYSAHPFDPARQEAAARSQRRSALWRLFVAGFGMMQVMMYALPAYVAQEGEMTRDIEQLLRWASLTLTLPVVLYSAAPFFSAAWRDLKAKRLGMDVPVALGVGGAFLASVWATLTGEGEVYFDSVTMFVFFLLCGRYLEMQARARAMDAAEKLVKLIPATALRLPDYPASRSGQRVAVAALQPGECVLVPPGEAVPADGRVLEGESRVDESLLTGESRLVARKAGDAVTGGAINAASPLVMRVEKVGQETWLAGIVRLMDRAASEKPRIAQLADRVAGVFVGALLAVALVAGAAWYGIAPEQAFWIAVSVLVVTCPCALSLATPAALTAATGSLTRRGVLTTRGHALETLARASHFVFDKTGTLTHGRMVLQEVKPLGSLSARRCLELARALEQGSEHPIGKALRAGAASAVTPSPSMGEGRGEGDARAIDPLPPPGPLSHGGEGIAETSTGVEPLPSQPASLANTPGSGIEAAIEGEVYRLGTPRFVAELTQRPLPDLPNPAGATVVALGSASGWLALYCLGDQVRSDAPELVHALQALGKQVCLLSGDSPAAAQHVAARLGIATVVAGATPAQKLEYVRAIQRQGGVVAMVGDGVNDAPVLAQAQVSVAMGQGTEAAQASADMVLLSGRLGDLLAAVTLARKTLRVIRQNLWWAFAYNFLALPLAVLGHVTPWMAGIGMSASSLLVVANALRLLSPDSRPGARAP